MIIGIDFDNTVVSYDELFHKEALAFSLISPDVPKIKKSIRDFIREKFDDIAWQKLQAEVYGPEMGNAVIIPGVTDFMRLCGEHVKFFIVSHKTEYAKYDNTGINLREASLDWMERHGLFSDPAFRFCRDDVFFETTRREKIERISALKCTHFIDDLEEVLLEESFNKNICRILLSQSGDSQADSLVVCKNWLEIADYLFNA